MRIAPSNRHQYRDWASTACILRAALPRLCPVLRNLEKGLR